MLPRNQNKIGKKIKNETIWIDVIRNWNCKNLKERCHQGVLVEFYAAITMLESLRIVDSLASLFKVRNISKVQAKLKTGL